MKIIYCTHSVCNPGGMERVLEGDVSGGEASLGRIHCND